MNERQETLLTVDIAVEVPIEKGLAEKRLLEVISTVCSEIARVEDLAPAEVSVTIVDDERIRELNHTYRGRDAATDVLSFALLEGAQPDVEDSFEEIQVLGDIVISWPRVLAQASEYGHSIERELAFLTAHGFLHLLGYDHESEEEETAMFGRQEKVLADLGFTR